MITKTFKYTSEPHRCVEHRSLNLDQLVFGPGSAFNQQNGCLGFDPNATHCCPTLGLKMLNQSMSLERRSGKFDTDLSRFRKVDTFLMKIVDLTQQFTSPYGSIPVGVGRSHRIIPTNFSNR